MPHFPPKGVRPPQLEGKRTGRPKGSKNLSRALRGALWGYQNRYKVAASPPTGEALLWRRFAASYPEAVEQFLGLHRML
jgi:hypothetical protein